MSVKEASGKLSSPSGSDDHDATCHSSRGNSTHRQSPGSSGTRLAVHSARLSSRILQARVTGAPSLFTSTRNRPKGRVTGFMRKMSLKPTPREMNRHCRAGGSSACASSLRENSRSRRAPSRWVLQSARPVPSKSTSVSSAAAGRAAIMTAMNISNGGFMGRTS